MIFTNAANTGDLLEWRDWVDISKIKVKNYKSGGELAKFQFSQLPEGRFYIYRTGASWMNGRFNSELGAFETEKRIGKQWPYILDMKFNSKKNFGGKKARATPTLGSHAYVVVSLHNPNVKSKSHSSLILLHSLVMKAFYPKLFIGVEDPSKMITNHKGNTWDYRPCKLSVITKSENTMRENLVNNGVDLQLQRAIDIKRTGFSEGGMVGRSYTYDGLYNEEYTKKELEKIKRLIKEEYDLFR